MDLCLIFKAGKLVRQTVKLEKLNIQNVHTNEMKFLITGFVFYICARKVGKFPVQRSYFVFLPIPPGLLVEI